MRGLQGAERAAAVAAESADNGSGGDRRAARRRLGWALAAVLALVALDQISKAWAVRALADGPKQVLGDFARLNLTRNPGGAFSSFQGLTPVLAVAAVGVAVFLVRAVARESDRVLLVGLVLVLAGALGNLLDRIFRDPGFLRGEVVDFVDVGRWPIFNLADSCITVGVILLIVRGFFAGDE